MATNWSQCQTLPNILQLNHQPPHLVHSTIMNTITYSMVMAMPSLGAMAASFTVLLRATCLEKLPRASPEFNLIVLTRDFGVKVRVALQSAKLQTCLVISKPKLAVRGSTQASVHRQARFHDRPSFCRNKSAVHSHLSVSVHPLVLSNTLSYEFLPDLPRYITALIFLQDTLKGRQPPSA